MQTAQKRTATKHSLNFFCLLAITLLNASLAGAQNTGDSASYFLHKFAQNIGRETYHVLKTGETVQYDVSFKFTDRGSPVPLKAQLQTSADAVPISLFIKGNTSRFSAINDTVRIHDQQVFIKEGDSVYTKALPALAFPVGGYSPGTVQMVLLKYWKLHNKPALLPLLPNGAVSISLQGADTLNDGQQPLVLNRYILSGLVWGNEILWTDNNDHLVCLITNDAEGDKLEMMLEKYESLLPNLISKAAVYGMELFSSSMQQSGAANKIVAITGAKLVDVESGEHLNNATIVIENGVIKQLGQTGTVVIPAAASIIHAEGKTVVPGLWDMHAHFEQAEWGPAYLAAGTTTVRDCGNEFVYINAIKQAIDSHKGVGPLILKAGIIDGPGAFGLGIVRASTAQEAVAAVRMYKESGFAQIKIYSSVKPAIVKAIATEAHRLGLTVTGHIPEGMTTRAAMDSGMDQVNHIQYVYEMMKTNPDRSIDFKNPETIAAIAFLKAHHAVIDPTLTVFELVFRSLANNIHDIEPQYSSLPLPLQSLFINMGMPAANAKKFEPLMASSIKLVKVLHDNGVIIVAGTDMGFAGFSLAREMELYVKAGLTPLEALQTATILPAKVMQLDKQSGSIKIGKRADLVILDADPLADIRNTRKVWKVIKEGQLYDPAVLHTMAGFVAAHP